MARGGRSVHRGLRSGLQAVALQDPGRVTQQEAHVSRFYSCWKMPVLDNLGTEIIKCIISF